MATTYTTQYTNAYVTSPPGNNYAMGSRGRYYPFDLVRTASGAANDLTYLVKIPPLSTLDMLKSWFSFLNSTATETIDIGWLAYTNEDGTAAAADDDGLIDGVLMTTDATWCGGALITGAAIAQSLPIVNRKVFSNKGEVTLFASFKVAAPGADDEVHGAFYVITP